MLLAIMRTLCLIAVMFGSLGSATAQDRDLSATGNVLAGEYSTGAAMAMLYGGYDAQSKSSVWAPRHGAAYDKSWRGKVRVRPISDSAYSDDGAPRHMLITWARPDEVAEGQYTCHACGVLLGVSVFRKDGNDWKVEASDLQLVETGAWGQPPAAKLQRLGVHTFGFAASISDMHFGEIEEVLWIYGPKAGRFAEWFEAVLADMDPDRGFKDDWCKTQSGGELDVMCWWERIDYAMAAMAGKEMYSLVRTERRKGGVVRKYWRFDGKVFVAAAKP
jgi:hypothetical protein